MDQVLGLVLPYLLDVKTFLVCSTLSQQSQKLVQDAVRLNLAPLVKPLPESAMKRFVHLPTDAWPTDEPYMEMLQLLWLCRTAGPAGVNTHDSACAVLCALDNMPFVITDGFKESALAPLVMTTRLLAHATVEHISLLILILEHCNTQQVDVAVRTLAVALKEEMVDAAALTAEANVLNLLNHATPANLPELLRMLTSCTHQPGALQVLARLLEHNRDHVHLLHPTADDNSAGQQQGAAATQAARTDSLLQRQQQHSPAAALVKELLEVAIMSRSRPAVDLLCSVPTASMLEAPQMMQLMLAAAFRLSVERSQPTAPCIMASLCSLPAAQALPAASIAAVLYRGIKSSCWFRLLPLLQLPNAKQMSTQGLCWLMKAAVAAEAYELLAQLCRLAQGRRLERRPLLELIKLFLGAYSRPGGFHRSATPAGWELTDGFLGVCTDRLDDLQPGERLTGDDVLELLEFFTEGGYADWGVVCWQPAASHIKDTPRLVRVLQGLACTKFAEDPGFLQHLPDKIPAVRQLGAADWCTVLACAFRAGRRMPTGCLEMPGVQQLDAEQLGKLLRVCSEKELYDEIAALLQLPAVQLLHANTVNSVLQQLLQDVPSDVCGPDRYEGALAWAALLALPQAAEMSSEAVQQLYDTAVDKGLGSSAQAILEALPRQAEAVRPVQVERLKHGILAALKRVSNGAHLEYWNQAKLLYTIDTSSCVQLLVALLQLTKDESEYVGDSTEDPDDRRWVQVHLLLLYLQDRILAALACRDMTSRDIIRISKACFGSPCCNVCVDYLIRYNGRDPDLMELYQGCCWQQHAALLTMKAVTALPAAADINTCQLQELLCDACQAFLSVDLFMVLMRLPAAQQMPPAHVAAVLSKVLCCYSGKYRANSIRIRGYSRWLYDWSMVDKLLQQPWAEQLTADDIGDMLVYIVQQPAGGGLLGVVRRLLRYAGKQLSSDIRVRIMQVTVWEKTFVPLAGLCLRAPGAASMTTDHVHQLLELVSGHDWSAGAVPHVLQLPAAQQLSLDQVKPVLWQACQFGDKHMCEALCALPALAAAQDDTEVQVMLANVELFGLQLGLGHDVHDDRGWCSCPRCAELH